MSDGDRARILDFLERLRRAPRAKLIATTPSEILETTSCQPPANYESRNCRAILNDLGGPPRAGHQHAGAEAPASASSVTTALQNVQRHTRLRTAPAPCGQAL